ncbi:MULTISPECIES: GntR family transcriptional regulator [unclassified Achromobacter]|uniref:GntR family transcriptional regulator n=1 Tax=unclassified Achromobacter TaxID=2626865 RepID=UPI000B5191FC|nr:MULTISPECIES: GntR family transcriptional regulator [unclassified Achromobacter]OWT68861.1 GntR family transcriptional regulator [Achromobacter sp. HZ28]OWT78576.1 GntR family transcriptional regulator [Achromobacter sp. HZ34]
MGDGASPLPLYHKVYLLLRQRLLDGDFGDEALPGEHALAETYGVSRLTVRRAMDTLAADGLVSRRQGRGTFAQAPAEMATPQQGASVDALMMHLSRMGMHTQVKLLELAVEPASPAVAGRLEVPVGAPVHRSVRVRSYEDAVFSYLQTYVPDAIGKRISRKALGSKPLLQIFGDLGIRVMGAEQTVTAVMADPDSAQALQVPVASALLNIRRLVRDTSGRPVEYLDARYRPDRFEYRLDMQAHETSGTPVWLPAAPAGARRH